MNRKKRHTAKKIPYLWGAAVLMIIGGTVFAGLYLEKSTTINNIEFSGNYYTETEDLHAAIQSPVGMPADSISFTQVFEDLKSLPYIKDVSVTMNHRGILNFRLTEHEPLAMLTNNVQRFYIAEGGSILPIISGKTSDVPILYAWEAIHQQQLAGETYAAIEEFLIAARMNRLGWATISEISWNIQEGITALSNKDGVKLIFGKENFQEKFTKWEAFYGQVIPVQGLDVFHTVDLRFAGQIVTRNS